MASLPCDICQQENAVLLASDLRDGATQAVGESCLVTYALSMAASVTSGMPSQVARIYGELFDKIAANDSRPKPSGVQPAAVKPRATRRAASAATATNAAATLPPTTAKATPTPSSPDE